MNIIKKIVVICITAIGAAHAVKVPAISPEDRITKTEIDGEVKYRVYFNKPGRTMFAREGGGVIAIKKADGTYSAGSPLAAGRLFKFSNPRELFAAIEEAYEARRSK